MFYVKKSKQGKLKKINRKLNSLNKKAPPLKKKVRNSVIGEKNILF